LVNPLAKVVMKNIALNADIKSNMSDKNEELKIIDEKELTILKSLLESKSGDVIKDNKTELTSITIEQLAQKVKKGE
jgi:hypothetical protein